MPHARCTFEVVAFEPGSWRFDVSGGGMELGRATHEVERPREVVVVVYGEQVRERLRLREEL